MIRIKLNSLGWCRDFIESHESPCTSEDLYGLIKTYEKEFPKYILDLCGAEDFSEGIAYIVYTGIREYINDWVKDENEMYANHVVWVAEDLLQYHFRNFRREWKRYGIYHDMARRVDFSVFFLLSGIQTLFQNYIKKDLSRQDIYFGLRIIEYVLMKEHNVYVLKIEEKKKQLREEEKAMRELKREKEQAEKDELKAKAALEKNQSALAKAKTAKQIQKLNEQIEELKVALQRAIERKERAISMAQQTRCGYVYVISNIGSFGEGVYKIGMTRRVDPMQRVRELGDASVPFPFDVHAMIYTEDAPSLETHLHKTFDLHKVNAVNWRKEYFKVPLSDIRNEVEKFGIQCEWMETPEAVQYRDSEWIREIGNLDAEELNDFIDKNPEKFACRNQVYEYNPFEELDMEENEWKDRF